MSVELSVAIIFKNEIRCIERCLKSLQPLREYLSVQIVMADTGSTDGSRAVAERYADVLFDFPWINDFSAARNAVLERCTGNWALIMDCDEWLKADRAELKKILKGKALLDGAQLRNRSYATSDFEAYTDVYQLRLLRMAAKPHYTGAIHEQVNFSSGTGHGVQLVNSMLHHDGYVMLNDGSEMGKAKRARNIRILRAEVEKAPDSLRRILELLDAADMEPDYLDLLRDAVARIERHSPEWEKYGPSILRKAVQEAHRHSLQEWEKWVQTAWQLFPKSWYTRIDVNHFQMTWAYTRGNYEETVRAGEQYLSACQALRLDLASMDDEMIAPLLWSSVAALEDSRVILSNAYLLLGVPDQAVNLLRQIDWQNITEGALANTLELLSQLYSFSEQHVSEITVALWCAVCDESRDTERMRRRKEAFLRYGKTYLSTAQMPQETGEAPVWSFLLSLRGKCVLGDYAAVMVAQTPEETDAALAAIEDLSALPPSVYDYALKKGATLLPSAKAELSVAIIFKNEIRCIERCLKSLQPLRQRFSLQIVMADTGSDDGSRAVAERYADVLFDFPWINDFSAARNAALERCIGDWILVMDCDEWLDGNLDELEQILHGRAAEGFDIVSVLVRNYSDYNSKALYVDFPAHRLIRRTICPRYSGRIHEAITVGRPLKACPSGFVLHHDGYVEITRNTEEGKAKLKRNMELLRAELEETPEDLRRWCQVMDSCSEEPDCMELVYRAVELVKERKPEWQRYGAAILRRAVQRAYERMLPETLTFADKARALFPYSYFTRIDVERYDMLYRQDSKDYAACLKPGEAYLRGCAALRAETKTPTELSVATLGWVSPYYEEYTKLTLADYYRRLGNVTRATALYEAADWKLYTAEILTEALKAVGQLYCSSDADLSGVIVAAWQAASSSSAATERRTEKTDAFLAFGRAAFTDAERPVERQRPLWSLFLPLRGKCVLGDYAAVMVAQTPEETDAALAAIEDLSALPPSVYDYALKKGATLLPSAKTELSVAIIFKNEIRCIERCLKSLQPLRQRFSLQIVMADTGSDDGSRAVAERYADVLFDFPWINDFSAARNAALERCIGDWILVMDCDEWLDGNLDELEQILHGRAAEGCDGANVLIRDYSSYDSDANYSDFLSARLVRLAAHARYEGIIHEALRVEGRPMILYSSGVMLHHDGYVAINNHSEEGKAKLRRNMDMLCLELERNPGDLRRWMQIVDSCFQTPNCMEFVRRAVALVEAHSPGWQRYGAAILRRAVQIACVNQLPETISLARKARELFPNSYFTRIDVERFDMLFRYRRQEYADCIVPGETYLCSCAELRTERSLPPELADSALVCVSPRMEEETRILMADVHRILGHSAKALTHCKKANWDCFNAKTFADALRAVMRLYTESGETCEAVIRSLWSSVRRRADSSEKDDACLQAFLAVGRRAFTEEADAEGRRFAWQMFLPLRGECVLGDYAAVMSAQTPEEADAALAAIEDLTALPPAVFVHALKTGAAFPLPGRELTVEQSDAMAAMLAEDRPFLREAALFAAEAFETTADLIWARSLALTAFKANDWAADEEPMALLRSFVKVESVFLPLCYAETALREPWLLPPMQRFALHLTSAFAVLFPDAVSPSFPPTGERSVHGALAELKLAAVAAPQQKAAINAFLDTLSTT